MFELDERYSLIQRHMEAQLKKSTGQKQTSHLTSEYNLNLEGLERKLVNKIGDSISSLGDVITDQGRKQRKLV